jgi:hypothetical protein
MIKPINIYNDNLFRLYREETMVKTEEGNLEIIVSRGGLDKMYLRTSAVYKFLKAGKITWERAEELLHKDARDVLNIWKKYDVVLKVDT